MLNITDPADLADRLGLPPGRLFSLLGEFDRFVRPVRIGPATDGPTARTGHRTLPPLCGVQNQFYARVLKPNLPPSPYSHGGVPGRSVRTNAAAHRGQRFAFTTDVARFFPTIRYERVGHLFRTLGCPPVVADLCTRLCTYRTTLPQGFCTSSIIADQIMKPIDRLIVQALPPGVVYTRFVDDITVSGPFDFQKSRIPELVRRVLRAKGFRVNPSKERFGRLGDGGVLVTKVRALERRIDANTDYLGALEQELRRHATAGRPGGSEGPFSTHSALSARIEWVCSLNGKRRTYLYSLLAKIDWAAVRRQQQTTGPRPGVTRCPHPRPDGPPGGRRAPTDDPQEGR